MIQRIQTLYLFVVFLLMGAMCLFPLANFIRETEMFRLTAWGVRTVGEYPVYEPRLIYMSILLGLSTLLPLVTIFLYKKRLVQIRLCFMEIVFLVGMQVYAVIYLYRCYLISDKIVFSLVDIFPLLGIVLTWVALRKIIKDEALVRSLNRIR